MSFTIAVVKEKFGVSLRLIIDFLDGNGSHVKKLRESNHMYRRMLRDDFSSISGKEYTMCKT